MAVSDSNTYSTPGQGLAVATSRVNYNSSIRALLQNFYSPAIPDTDNLIENGAALTASQYDGVLYRKSDTGMLYISDSGITSASGRTNNPIGGDFTRYGIAWRQQGSVAAADANIASFDIGEAFVVVRDTGGSSNNSIWLRIRDTGTFDTDFLRINKPHAGSITAIELADNNVTTAKLVAESVTNAKIATATITSDKLYNTFTAPNSNTIGGLANTSFLRTDIATFKTAGSLIANNDIKTVYGNTTTNAQIYFNSANSNINVDLFSVSYYKIMNPATGKGMMVSSDTGDFTTTGDITGFGTVSDRRQKENIVIIENPLDKIQKLSGYTFNYTHRPNDKVAGVIAQEVREVLPEAVYNTDSYFAPNDPILAVRYNSLIPLLIETIKELNNKVDKLENKLNDSI